MPNKESRTIEEQITLLKNRGMLFANEQDALVSLNNISYYRLKGYWWDMQSDKINHRFSPGSYFDNVIERYNFEHQLPQKAIIANEFGLNLHSELSSWIESISFLRNIIAHHSRIWGRNMIKRTTLPKSIRKLWLSPNAISIQEEHQHPKPFLVISTMVYLCDSINQNNKIRFKLLTLINDNPNIPIQKLGFFKNWQNEKFWK